MNATAQKVEWELISEEPGESTDRLRVPGGWLYRSIYTTAGDESLPLMAMVFVPAAPDIHEGRADEVRDERDERARHRAAFTLIADEDLPF